MKIKNLHRWNVKPETAIRTQVRLAKKIRLVPLRKEPKIIAGCDVFFQEETAIGSIVVMSYPDLQIIEEIRRETFVKYPYIPTLLTYREAPALIPCFRKLRTVPDVFIFDGQGISHQRRLGLAAHMGLILSRPTIGCTGKRLFGTGEMPGKKRASFTYLKDKERNILGAILRTKERIKPVAISPGNKITLEEAVKIILKCTARYRLPEPIRAAHRLASLNRRQRIEDRMK